MILNSSSVLPSLNPSVNLNALKNRKNWTPDVRPGATDGNGWVNGCQILVLISLMGSSFCIIFGPVTFWVPKKGGLSYGVHGIFIWVLAEITAQVRPKK